MLYNAFDRRMDESSGYNSELICHGKEIVCVLIFIVHLWACDRNICCTEMALKSDDNEKSASGNWDRTFNPL